MSSLVDVHHYTGGFNLNPRDLNGAWIDNSTLNNRNFLKINELYKFKGLDQRFISGMLYNIHPSQFIIFKITLNGDIFCGVLDSDPLPIRDTYYEKYSDSQYSSLGLAGSGFCFFFNY